MATRKSNPALRRSRQEILESLRACCVELGKAPGIGVFEKMTGVGAKEVRYYWPRHSDLIREAGYQPNTLTAPLSEDTLFREYARVCLHYNKVPTRPELDIATRELRTQTATARSRYGIYRNFVGKFQDWLKSLDDGELKKILEFPGWDVQSAGALTRTKINRNPSPLPALRPWLPACLQFFEVLARGERPPHENPTADINILFERRCADAFQCLGFNVTRLGQGKGRLPDLFALANKERFAVLVDAKLRRDQYVVGTEDRKFSEYADQCSKQLTREGFDRLYFVIVSSSFQESDANKLNEYLTGSPVRRSSLITARALMRLVEDSIRNRSSFQLGEIEKLISTTSLVST